MPRFQTVTLRGEPRDVVVDRDHGYEPDTNAHEIEWHFEGLTPDEHDALALTDAEEDSIYQQLAAADPEE